MYKRITHTIIEEHYDYDPFQQVKLNDDIAKLDLARKSMDVPTVISTVDTSKINENFKSEFIKAYDDVYVPTNAPLRDQVDLRNWASPVDDQSKLGSCTANAVVNAYELLDNQYYQNKGVDLSRLFVYYNTRLLEGTINSDSGAFIHEALKSLDNYGVCTEEMWPYDIEKFVVKPSELCYKNAEKRKIKTYQRINSVSALLDALNNNRPVPVGLTIYDNFGDLDFRNSIVTKPLSATTESEGGHALCIVGYDLNKQLLLAKNSFGVDWGDKGYCWIPFDYARENMYDMWMFELTTDLEVDRSPMNRSSAQ